MLKYLSLCLLLMTALTAQVHELIVPKVFPGFLPKALKALTYQPPAFYLKHAFSPKSYEGLKEEEIDKIIFHSRNHWPSPDECCYIDEIPQMVIRYSHFVDDKWRITCDLFPTLLTTFNLSNSELKRFQARIFIREHNLKDNCGEYWYEQSIVFYALKQLAWVNPQYGNLLVEMLNNSSQKNKAIDFLKDYWGKRTLILQQPHFYEQFYDAVDCQFTEAQKALIQKHVNFTLKEAN